MKNTLLRLCMIGFVVMALAACGGRHDHDKDNNQPADTTTAVKPTEEKGEHKEHHEKTEEHKERKDTVQTEKGTPTVDTTLAEKPKDESTMGSTGHKHVKPGGVHGTN